MKKGDAHTQLWMAEKETSDLGNDWPESCEIFPSGRVENNRIL
jgi:hypothetical protein